MPGIELDEAVESELFESANGRGITVSSFALAPSSNERTRTLVQHPGRADGLRPRVNRVTLQALSRVHVHLDILAIHRALVHHLERTLLLLSERAGEAGGRRSGDMLSRGGFAVEVERLRVATGARKRVRCVPCPCELLRVPAKAKLGRCGLPFAEGPFREEGRDEGGGRTSKSCTHLDALARRDFGLSIVARALLYGGGGSED